jgi:hypothetical protein
MLSSLPTKQSKYVQAPKTISTVKAYSEEEKRRRGK